MPGIFLPGLKNNIFKLLFMFLYTAFRSRAQLHSFHDIVFTTYFSIGKNKPAYNSAV